MGKPFGGKVSLDEFSGGGGSQIYMKKKTKKCIGIEEDLFGKRFLSTALSRLLLGCLSVGNKRLKDVSTLISSFSPLVHKFLFFL